MQFQYFGDERSRYPRQPDDRSSNPNDHNQKTHQRTSPSEAVPVFLPFPETEPNRRREEASSGRQLKYEIKSIFNIIPRD